MSCTFCQNYTLSQGRPQESTLEDARAASIVESALRERADSISFTYNEPTVSIELIHAVAPRAAARGLPCILVSNAFVSPACMDLLRPMVHGVNFDLKSFSDHFYRTYCGARLEPVLETMETAVRYGWWVELTTLLIPGLNDSDAELRAMAAFIHKRLGRDVPWHLSRFRPMYKMLDAPPTPVASLERARDIGLKEGLRFVYTGNVPGHDGESTYCPDCGALIVRRRGYRLESPVRCMCPQCAYEVPGVWFPHMLALPAAS